MQRANAKINVRAAKPGVSVRGNHSADPKDDIDAVNLRATPILPSFFQFLLLRSIRGSTACCHFHREGEEEAPTHGSSGNLGTNVSCAYLLGLEAR